MQLYMSEEKERKGETEESLQLPSQTTKTQVLQEGNGVAGSQKYFISIQMQFLPLAPALNWAVFCRVLLGAHLEQEMPRNSNCTSSEDSQGPAWNA